MTVWDVIVALAVVAALIAGGSYLYYEFRVRRLGPPPMPPAPPETPNDEPPPSQKPPRTPR